MKNFITIISLTLFASNAYALNIGSIVDGAGKESTKAINENVNKKIDQVVDKFEKKIDGYKAEMDAEINKYKDQIKEAEAAINKIKQIRANAESYIKTAKIILGLLSSGILALIFIMWRIWRNIVTMKKVIKNVASYDDIEKILKAD
jgi:ribosome-associated translation inhibitor RaiA